MEDSLSPRSARAAGIAPSGADAEPTQRPRGALPSPSSHRCSLAPLANLLNIQSRRRARGRLPRQPRPLLPAACRHQRQQHHPSAPGARHGTGSLPAVPPPRRLSPAADQRWHPAPPGLTRPSTSPTATALRLLRGDTPGSVGRGRMPAGGTVWEQIDIPASSSSSRGKARGALEGSVNQRRHFSRSAVRLGCLRLTLFFFCDLITLDWCLC